MFVSFYCGLCGLAPTAELGLSSPAAKPESAFTIGQVQCVLFVGSARGWDVYVYIIFFPCFSDLLSMHINPCWAQVVRARVMQAHPVSGKLKLSLRSGKGAAEAAPAIEDPFAGLQPGDVVSGRVLSAQVGYREDSAIFF